MLAALRRAADPRPWAAVILLTTLPAFCQPPKPAPIPVVIPLPGGMLLRFEVPAAAPEAVLLTPGRYKDLLDQIERLQLQLAAQPPQRPRACELEGRVEQRGQQTVVRLKATFKFTTTEAKAVVFLGCQKAHVVEVRSDDGKVPLLTATDDGLRVQADGIGEHIVRLDLDVAVTARGQKGADFGFEMGLPGAPITALTFEPPAGVRRFTLTTRAPKPAGAGGPDQDTEVAEAERFQPGKGGSPLGPVTSLGLGWDDPQKKAAVVRSAEADVLTTVGPDEIVTEARLRLKGGATEWRFTAPAAADVAVGPWPGPAAAKAPSEFAPDRAPVVTRPEPGQSVWALRFRDPPVGDLLLTVTARSARNKTGPIPVGPFAVLDAPHQVGTVRLRTPVGWKATAAPRGDTRRDPDEAGGEPVYRYSLGVTAKAPDPPLTFTLSAAPGVVTARTRTELRLGEAGWRLRTEVSVSPSRAEVEAIEFEAPPGFTPTQAEPREIVEGLSAARDLPDGRRVYRVRFVSPKRAAFAFTVDGEYPGPAAGPVTLVLPRFLGVTERAAELIVATPPRFEVGGSFRVWEGAKPGTWETPLDVEPNDKESRVRGTADRPIALAQVNWPAAAGGVAVRSTTDVSLEPGWTRVVQRLAYTFAARPPARLRLTGPPAIGAVRTSRGAVEQAVGGWEIVVPADVVRGLDVVLTYAVRTAVGETVTPAVLVPEVPDGVQTLRLWAADGRTLAVEPAADWAEGPAEVVADRPSLPGLVVRARGPAAPPTVRVGPARADATDGPVVLRAAVEVRAVGDVALCRARFWVGSWGRDPEVLVPAAARGAEVYLSGKQVQTRDAGEAAGLRGYRLPVAASSPAGVVEVRYRLPWRPEVSFQHPGFARSEVVGDVTWTVWPPVGRVPLVVGATTANWTPAAFLGTLGLGRYAKAPGDGTTTDAGPVVLTRGERGPVRLVLVPRHVWVLACSAVAFVLFLGLAACSRGTRRWLAVGGLVGGTALAVWLPQPLSRAAFGVVPGVLAAGVTLVAVRALRARHRARAARASGFARAGSTPGRPSSLRGRGPTTAPMTPIAPVPSGSWAGQ